MANAVLTVAKVADQSMVEGARDTVVATLTFDNGTYVTGGFSVTPASLGLRLTLGMLLVGGNTAALAFPFYYDTQAAKVKFLGTTAGTIGLAPFQELAATVAMANAVFTVLILGKR